MRSVDDVHERRRQTRAEDFVRRFARALTVRYRLIRS
jgi:hypothetical protein